MLKGKANGAAYQVQLYTDHDWEIFKTEMVPSVQIEAFGKAAVLTISCNVNVPATASGVAHTLIDKEKLGKWCSTGEVQTVQDNLFVRITPNGLLIRSVTNNGNSAATGYKYVTLPYIRVG